MSCLRAFTAHLGSRRERQLFQALNGLHNQTSGCGDTRGHIRVSEDPNQEPARCLAKAATGTEFCKDAVPAARAKSTGTVRLDRQALPIRSNGMYEDTITVAHQMAVRDRRQG